MLIGDRIGEVHGCVIEKQSGIQKSLWLGFGCAARDTMRLFRQENLFVHALSMWTNGGQTVDRSTFPPSDFPLIKSGSSVG
jgi:hypothetical protein